jgi:hypothetical protein
MANVFEMNEATIIESMCYTMRHDFGITKKDDDFSFDSGMTEKEQEALRTEMRKLYNHHIKPLIGVVRRDEREACAKICEGQENEDCLGEFNIYKECAKAIRGRG